MPLQSARNISLGILCIDKGINFLSQIGKTYRFTLYIDPKLVGGP